MIWHILLLATCIQILIDGFLIYWIYPIKLMHFIKDALLILTIFFMLSKEPLKIWMERLGRALGPSVVLSMGCVFFVGMLQVFNPASPGVLRGVIGMKLMFLPWLFILLGFAYAEHPSRIEKIFRLVAYISIPINFFGLIQFFNPPDFLVRTFGPGFIYTTQVAMIYGVLHTESFFRIIGTFPSSAHYAQFLAMNTLICYALMMNNRRERPLLLGALALTLMALLGTGSRGGLLCTIVMLMIMGAFSRQLRFVLVTGLLFFGILAIGLNTMGKNIAKRFESAANVKNVSARTIEATPKMFLKTLEKYPMGNGIGAASQAARHLGGMEGHFVLIENYFSKIQYEIGIVGVASFTIFIFSLIARWINSWIPSIYDPAVLNMALALTAYCLTELTIGVLFSGIESPPNSVYLWLFIGFMARISTYNKQGQ
jgi:hypothetical protein